MSRFFFQGQVVIIDGDRVFSAGSHSLFTSIRHFKWGIAKESGGIFA
jgi:hypothetical protein